jgi:hypothetical protein
MTSALDGGEWSDSRPSRFTPGERTPYAHWRGGWVGPGAGLDAVEHRKSLDFVGNRTPAVQPRAIPTELSQLLNGVTIFSGVITFFRCKYF